MVTDIIFDGDDTLWFCAKYYIEVRNEFSAFQEARTGIPAPLCDKILNDIDLTCTKLPNAFARSRYPRSFMAASYALDIIADLERDDTAAHKSWTIAENVFAAPYELFPDVIHMLTEYKAAGKRIYLLTKGPEDVQRRKIVMHGLDKIFDANKIYIVPKKGIDEMKRIQFDHHLRPATVMMVGDSMKDDIGSAIDAGFQTVHIGHPDKPKWAYDDQSHIPDHTLLHVTDLPTIVPYEQPVA